MPPASIFNSPQLFTQPEVFDQRVLADLSTTDRLLLTPGARVERIGGLGASEGIAGFFFRQAQRAQRQLNNGEGDLDVLLLNLAGTFFSSFQVSPSFRVTQPDGSVVIVLGGEPTTETLVNQVPVAGQVGASTRALFSRLRNVLRPRPAAPNTASPILSFEIDVTPGPFDKRLVSQVDATPGQANPQLTVVVDAPLASARSPLTQINPSGIVDTRFLRGSDPAVPELVNELSQRGFVVTQVEVKVFGTRRNGPITDIDVVVDPVVVIQVKVGSGRGAPEQAVVRTPQATDLPVLVFDGGKLIDAGKSFRKNVKKELQRQGVFFTDDLNILIDEIERIAGERK